MHTEAIYLALDSQSGMHCLVRLVPIDELGQPYAPVDIDNLNRLLMARDPEALVVAARDLGPMYPGGKDGAGREELCFRPSGLRAEDGAKPRFETPDPEKLLRECYFDPYAEPDNSAGLGYHQTGRLARSASKRIADAFGIQNARDYSFADDGFRYLIEPLHDWVFARNLLSITLRIGGLLRANPMEESVLTAAGFTHMLPDTRYLRIRMGDSCYVAPIGFNPFYRDGGVIANSISFSEGIIWPLFSSITDVKKSNLIKQVIDNHLVTDERVKFLTAVNAGQVDGSLSSRDVHSLVHTWWYIALVSEEGMTQRDVANMLLQALDRALFSPELTYSGVPMREVEPAAKPKNLLEAMWLIVRNHPDRYLLTCDYCHRTVFSGTQGGERRFCSNSCRAAWNKEHRR